MTIRLDPHIHRILSRLKEYGAFPWDTVSDVARYCIISRSKELVDTVGDKQLQSVLRDYDDIRSVVAQQKLSKAARDIYQAASDLLQTMEAEDPQGAKVYAASLLARLLRAAPQVKARYQVLIARCTVLVNS